MHPYIKAYKDQYSADDLQKLQEAANQLGTNQKIINFYNSIFSVVDTKAILREWVYEVYEEPI